MAGADSLFADPYGREVASSHQAAGQQTARVGLMAVKHTDFRIEPEPAARAPEPPGERGVLAMDTNWKGAVTLE